MKKISFIIASLAISVVSFTQSAWDFSALYPLTSGNVAQAAQGVKDNLGFFVNPFSATPNTAFTIDFSSKKFAASSNFSGGALTSRLKLGGKGSDSTSINCFLPTTNFLYFNVKGPCEITVFCRASTSNAIDGRSLYITDGTKLLGSYTPPVTSSDEPTLVKASYTGNGGVIYIYGYKNAFNIYRIEVSANMGETKLIPATK